MSFKVRIVGDSMSQWGHRITSMLITFPRMILSEFNTHRMLSRNSASSRAIPFEKMVDSVMSDPFIPMKWMKEHKGMQGTEYLTDEKPEHIADSDLQFRSPSEAATHAWLRSRDEAVRNAVSLSAHGVTKQICNRLLEPFMWHTCMVTATEWENFFALRAHPAAEIHMQHLATLMLDAMNYSTPKILQEGEWHIPFEDEEEIDINQVVEFCESSSEKALKLRVDAHAFNIEPVTMSVVKMATMMAARTSYTVAQQELSEWTPEKYQDKHDDMQENKHWSPFEHCAQHPTEQEYFNSYHGEVRTILAKMHYGTDEDYRMIEVSKEKDDPGFGWWGNFHGWKQYRKMFPNENSTYPRLIGKPWPKIE